MSDFPKEQELTLFQNACFGGLSGAFTGVFVAPLEHLKVRAQSIEIIIRKQQTSIEIIKSMAKSIPSFSFLFSCVCALEFSVNETIKNLYGKYCGIAASGLTGAFFLTAADHLIFRSQKGQKPIQAIQIIFKQNPMHIFTGFTPMFLREAVFITSVMYLGPYLGKVLSKNFKKQFENDELGFKPTTYGRILSGLMLTFATQPLDVLTREMQIKRFAGKEPKIKDCLKDLHQQFKQLDIQKQWFYNHGILKGAIPRMGLATFGGTLVGNIFDYFQAKYRRFH